MRSHLIRPLALLLMVGMIGVVGARAASADESSPTPDQPVSLITLASGIPVDAPGMQLKVERIVIKPGGEIPTHTHPGAYAIYIDSGQFDFTVIAGEAIYTKAGSSASEPIAAGATIHAQAGDAVFENGGVVHSARNAGTDDVVLYAASLLAEGQPPLVPTNDEGTPTS